MKRFDFPLERVRRWRETELGVARTELRKVQMELNRLRDLKEQLRRQLDQAQRALVGESQDGETLEADRFQALDEFRQFARRRELEITVEEVNTRKRLEVHRQKVVDARRNHRVLEKLKERALAEWEKQRDKEVENTAAELHLAKLVRLGRAGNATD